jgi:hypothetical protein
MAAKLLEMTFYRRFELEFEDCVFIRQARSELARLSPANRLERLRQIIKELQRHRFGRRAETLPEDQMLLGLGVHPV